MKSDFRVEATRGSMVESVHRVSLAVVDHTGRLLARSGDPDLVTYWRSAAKLFQVMPVVSEGAIDRFGFDARELALACASHSSEPLHLDVAAGMLQKMGLTEDALACGPHVSLSPAVADQVLRDHVVMTPRWNNCSGKHSAMLALALSKGWAIKGYETLEHPVQQRVLTEVSRWTDLAVEKLGVGIDGCTAVSVALPLRAMALAYARFGVSPDPHAVRIRKAVAANPGMIAGQGRLCTDLIAAAGELAFAKVGADGVYCAYLPQAGLGLALKVEDGDMRSLPTALLGLLRALADRVPLGFDPARLPESVTRHAEPPTLNTRGRVTGVLRANGQLQFVD